jgi:hypothetical protein
MLLIISHPEVEEWEKTENIHLTSKNFPNFENSIVSGLGTSKHYN